MSYDILVASFTDEIYHLEFTPPFNGNPGTLDLVDASTVGFSPSWITPHPHDPTVFFAALKLVPNGQIVAIHYSKEGKKLNVVGKGFSGGGGAASVLAAGRELFVAHYTTGHVSVLTFEESDSGDVHISDPQVFDLLGSGPHPVRQTSSHPHQVVLHSSREELLVPDLGCDKTWRFLRSTEDGRWELRGAIEYAPGQGPRHIVIRGDYLYTLHELSNEITVHHFPEFPASASLTCTIDSMCFSPHLPRTDSEAGGILFTTAPEPAILVSNRAVAPPSQGDIITTFAVTEGGAELEKIQEIHSGLNHLRAMEFIGEGDQWLIAGGVYGGGVRVFDRKNNMALVAEYKDIKFPTGFLVVTKCEHPRHAETQHDRVHFGTTGYRMTSTTTPR